MKSLMTFPSRFKFLLKLHIFISQALENKKYGLLRGIDGSISGSKEIGHFELYISISNISNGTWRIGSQLLTADEIFQGESLCQAN